jgi:hypothetical protein
MKSDRYLKVVLTVIAVCQVYFVAKDTITPAHAQNGPVPVNLVSINGVSVFYPLAVHPQ